MPKTELLRELVEIFKESGIDLSDQEVDATWRTLTSYFEVLIKNENRVSP
jgi:hypothetical protein